MFSYYLSEGVKLNKCTVFCPWVLSAIFLISFLSICVIVELVNRPKKVYFPKEHLHPELSGEL